MSEPDTPSRARAAACGLPPDGAAAEVTAAFLRSLPGEQFAPPEEASVAVNTLAGTALPLGARGELVAACDIAAEVAAFAAAFWSLLPAERLARWPGRGCAVRRPSCTAGSWDSITCARYTARTSSCCRSRPRPPTC
jgi:hypothetical protein